jgi:DNA-binding NarL/FixJ family response regulator
LQKKIKVLLIDDSHTILHRMQHLLSEIGCVQSIKTADNAFDGWTLFLSNEPEIVLLDIHMPKKNGVELLKEIKQHRSNIHVVMITNESMECYKPTCLKYGADFYLDKTNDFEKIPAIIENIAMNC